MAITLNGSSGISSPGGDTSTSLSTGLLTVTSSTAPTNGLYLPTTNTVALATNSTERLRLDASGNLGLGVTPSSWSGVTPALELGPTGGFFSVNNTFSATYNAYYNGTNYIYKTSRFASQYNQTSGQHQWYTAASGTAGATISFTQAMTLDASGNLGIGTSSPAAYGKLVVQVSTPSAAAQSAYLAGTDGTKTFILNQNGSSYSYAGSGANELWFYLNGSYSAMTFGSDGAVPIKFISNGSERARIDSSGNLLVGTTSALAITTIKGAGNTAASYGLWVQNSAGTETFKVRNDGVIVGLGVYSLTTASAANMYVATDGVFYRSTSSARYKNTITDAVHGLAEVLKLRPVTYKGNNDGDTVFGGLIAEEVHDAGLTEFVQYNNDGEPDALSYGNMVSLAFKAIQELTKRLEALEGAK